ncbi:non-structural maintenance of chromosomes element 3 homolog [Ptychodera flava]|uniref:non-structural maintenance of chromosomes element 3 homolog n=1 Tax=Ptychodera flava TaxID=63121 RepID=UPI003969F2F0
MPKATQKRPSLEVDDGDDDDMEMVLASQSQTMTQAEKAAAQLSPDTLEAKVNEIVQYMLIMEQKKIPVKKLDITKHILKDHRGIFLKAMEYAKTKLLRVYGFELTELGQGPGNKKQCYILLNTMDVNDSDHIDYSSEEPKVGLLMIVLSIVFMSGGVVAESIVWHALKKLGIYPDKSHEVFGDVKKLLTQEFVRQMYLEYNRVVNSDPPAYQFQWGQRALKETTKRKVLEFVTKMYGKDLQIDSWKSQYKEVLRSEGRPVDTMEDD